MVQWFLGKAETDHLEMLIVFIGWLLSTTGAELLQASREHKSSHEDDFGRDNSEAFEDWRHVGVVFPSCWAFRREIMYWEVATV